MASQADDLVASTSGVTLDDEADDLVPQVAPSLLPRLFATLFQSQQDPSSTPAYPSPLFATSEITSKGLGTVARQRIRRGELLISEAPLVVWPQDLSAQHARALVDDLSPQGQKRFWELGNAKPKGVLDEVLAIRATNGFAVELPPLEGEEGERRIASMVFPRIARFNHSCLPNADQAMNWRTLRMEIWATTDIEEGGEICFEYTPVLHLPHAARRSRLQDLFAFTCRCPLCASAVDELAASDRRREEVSRLVEQLGSVGGGGEREERKKRKMGALERLTELVREEGYLGVPEFEDSTVSQALVMYRQLKSRLLIDAANDDSGAVGLELGEGRTRARRESVSSVGSPSVQSKPVP